MTILCAWEVPPNHPAFAGHFPGNPIVPGVVLMDQAVLFAEQRAGFTAGIWSFPSMKFVQTVTAGDSLEFAFEHKSENSLDLKIFLPDRRLVASGSMKHQPDGEHTL